MRLGDLDVVDFLNLSDSGASGQEEDNRFSLDVRGLGQGAGSISAVRVLIVDDDLIFGRNFAAILKEKGYEADLVNNGSEAVLRLSGSYFDIVFLDIRLPDINGVEVFKKIREISPKVKVIILSAFPFDKTVTEAVWGGGVRYFSKPFDIAAVLEAVKELGG